MKQPSFALFTLKKWFYVRQVFWGLEWEDGRHKREGRASWKCWAMFQNLLGLGNFWFLWFILEPNML